MKNTMTE